MKAVEVTMAAANRGPAEILQIALKKEESSLKLYNTMLEGSKVQFVRELLQKLRDEEAKHVQMIRKRISQLEMGRG